MGRPKYYLKWAGSTWLGLLHQHRFCPLWDAKLNELLDKHWESAEPKSHTLTLGNAEVWTSNRFYSYGNLYRSGKESGRPSIRTMVRLASLEDHIKRLRRESDKAEYKQLINSIQ